MSQSNPSVRLQSIKRIPESGSAIIVLALAPRNSQATIGKPGGTVSIVLDAGAVETMRCDSPYDLANAIVEGFDAAFPIDKQDNWRKVLGI